MTHDPAVHTEDDHAEFQGERSAPSMSSAELEADAARLTRDLLTAMGFEATVTAQADDNRVEVRAALTSGEDHLTGRKGEVRQALQHILNRMVNRGGGSMYHLQLEINEFWQKREEELKTLANTLAEEALSRGGEAITEYLNAQERRIVHVALKEDTRVKTYALGTGLIKRVAVAPADYPEQERDDE
jgi:spoIIIJ-associated protein